MSAPESSPEFAPRRWTAPVYRLGEEPGGLIDLLTKISGIPDFGAAWTERVAHAFGGRKVMRPYFAPGACPACRRACATRLSAR